MANNINTENPWIGLNSYSEGQSLYGRDEEIEVLSSRIQYNIQTVVYGRSGIGKSSILCAGIFPRLRENNILPLRIRLEHNDKPYIEQIKECILQEISAVHYIADETAKRHCNKDGEFLFEESLWEFFHRYQFKTEDGTVIQPLIVLDQFEEIFTLERDRKKVDDFFVQLADLLNHTKPAYLNEYEEALYVESSEDDTDNTQINKSKISALLKKKTRHRTEFNYLEEDNFHIVITIREDYLSYLERNTTHIPLLKHNRYCLQPINEEQAAKIIMQPRPGLVDKATAKLIIEKVTGEKDFELDGNPEISVDSAVLSLYLSRLYEKKGAELQITPALIEKFGNNIIEDFYTETISNYPQSVIEYLEDTLINNEGHRENISVYNATHGCEELSTEILKELADNHKLIRRFSYNDSSRIEFIHDILCPVIKARKENRDQIRQQQKERMRQEEERQASLIRQQNERKKLLSIIAFISVIAVLIVVAITGNYLYHNIELRAYYRDFTYLNGWPVGVGEKMSETEAVQLTSYYCLVKHGWKSKNNPFTTVLITPINYNAVNSLSVPLVCKNDTTDEKAIGFALKLNNTRKLVFSGSSSGDVSKMTACDANDNVLYNVNYYGDTKNIWAIYTDNSGRPLILTHNADRMRIVRGDTLKLDRQYMFFDSNGIPQQNYNGDYGYSVTYDGDLKITGISHLNAFGEAECLERISYQGDSLKIQSFHGGNMPFFSILSHYNEKGNLTLLSYLDSKGGLIRNSSMPAVIRIKYDDLGRVVKKQSFTADDKPFVQNVSSDYYASVTYMYEGNSQRLLSEIRIDRDTAYIFKLIRTDTRVDSIVENRHLSLYVHMVNTYRNNKLVESAFFDKEGRRAYNAQEDYHRKVIQYSTGEFKQDTVKVTYYDENNSFYTEGVTKSVTVYDENGQRIRYITYNHLDEIITSMAYKYSNGVETARYACGVHDTPVRCPYWESEKLCYYILNSVRDYTDNLTNIQTVNEFGFSSLLYWGLDGGDMKAETPMTDDLGCGWSRSIINKVNMYVPKQDSTVKQLTYIHLTKAGLAADSGGLKDGDILLSSVSEWNRLVNGKTSCPINVRRYDKQKNCSETIICTVTTMTQPLGAEIYPVYYTQKEYEVLFN